MGINFGVYRNTDDDFWDTLLTRGSRGGGGGGGEPSTLKYSTELQEGEVGNDCFPSGKRLRDHLPRRQYTCYST